MDFYQLAYFRKVAETSSLSRAAAELHITQPAVSKQIRSLEDELGERLFDRIGKKVFLTRAGEVLLTHVDRILRSVDEAKTAVRDLSAECSGELVIGTSDHISIHRLPDVLKACITAFPKIDLKLRCHRSETILELVAKNQVDLGVITLQKTPPNITSRVIWKDPMSLVVPVGHPLTSAKRVRLKDIVQHGMILTEHATETRKMVDDVFAAQGLTPNVAMEVAYIETIKSLVRTGLGIAILPDRAVDAEVKSGALMRLRITDAAFARNLGVVYLKDKFLSRPAVEFLALLEKAGVGVQ
ncbi:MAG: LysR family transcriptional regulator [Nitrospiraceae bacterium]|jgi:DNA-binding transcriptional LysR family regulator|nr:LysR family transcriptional regulator [Nitrospiraceae bacterium]